jgi:hypothetical protein
MREGRFTHLVDGEQALVMRWTWWRNQGEGDLDDENMLLRPREPAQGFFFGLCEDLARFVHLWV